MEHLVLITSETSLVEWDSRIRRLWRFPELIIWVDVTLIGVVSMGKINHFPEGDESDPQTLGCEPHAILEPVFQAFVEGYLEAT